MDVQKELTELTKVGRLSDENTQVFYKRIFTAANAITDAQWAKLSDETQLWVNAASAAIEKGEPIPGFDGEVAVEASGVAAEAPAPKKGKKKAATVKAEEPAVESEKPAKKAKKEKKVAAEKPAATTEEEVPVKPAKVAKTSAKKEVAKPAKQVKKAPVAAAKANGKAKPKVAKEGDGGKGRKPKFLDTGKIKINVKDNPFRKGTKSEKWFNNYKNGMTVRAAIEAGTPRHHINWDVTLGNITVS